MNNTISEMKNSLEGINSRISEVEEWISEVEDKVVEITATQRNKEKRMKWIEESLRDLWENINCTNICIIGVPGEGRVKRCQENIWRDCSKNFPNMGKEIFAQVEVQSTPYRIKSRRNMPKHTLIKLAQIKYK